MPLGFLNTISAWRSGSQWQHSISYVWRLTKLSDRRKKTMGAKVTFPRFYILLSLLLCLAAITLIYFLMRTVTLLHLLDLLCHQMVTLWILLQITSLKKGSWHHNCTKVWSPIMFTLMKTVTLEPSKIHNVSSVWIHSKHFFSHKNLMIQKLTRVMGLAASVDPDPSYVLTVDNLIKILAIQMRFR